MTHDEALQKLLESTAVVVYAKDIAPVLQTHPSVLVNHAKKGTWPREICNYFISGRCVKFFRLDFLKKGGYIE